MNNENSLIFNKTKNGEIFTITINRPAKANVLNYTMFQELKNFFKSLKKENNLRCLIITGSGNKVFCGGADLKERINIDAKKWKEIHGEAKKMTLELLSCPVPVIAAINGDAYGGGLELILACDLAYATPNSVFALTEVRRGILPGNLGTQLLSRHCGIKKAKELGLTGRIFTAAEAHNIGIINQIHDSDELMKYVIAVAETIAANAPLSVRAIKRLIDASTNLDLLKGFKLETKNYYDLLDTEDRKEGINAFVEKRMPIFKGK